MIHIVKCFSLINEAEVDVFFLEWSCFCYGPTDVGNLISGSSAFSKVWLCIWKFSVHIVLNPSLKDFDHNLASIWNECDCVVVWTFFGIALLWDWNENWHFPVLWPLLSFLNLLTYWSEMRKILWTLKKSLNWLFLFRNMINLYTKLTHFISFKKKLSCSHNLIIPCLDYSHIFNFIQISLMFSHFMF